MSNYHKTPTIITAGKAKYTKLNNFNARPVDLSGYV